MAYFVTYKQNSAPLTLSPPLFRERYAVVSAQQQRVLRQANRLQNAALEQLTTASHRLAHCRQRLHPRQKDCSNVPPIDWKWPTKSVKAADPKRILRMGYSITYTLDGKTVRNVAQLPVDTLIETQFGRRNGAQSRRSPE